MLEKIKKVIFGDDNKEIDVSRRKFIRDAAGLAALTVVAAQCPTLLKVKSLEEKIASGLVEGETFYLTEGIVIDIPNVVIRNCRFIAQAPMDYMLRLGSNATNSSILDSKFESNGFANCCIHIEPQECDMSRIMQNVFNAVAESDNPTLYLKPGVFKIDSPIELPSNTILQG